MYMCLHGVELKYKFYSFPCECDKAQMKGVIFRDQNKSCDDVLRTHLSLYCLQLNGFVPQVTLTTITCCQVQKSEAE